MTTVLTEMLTTANMELVVSRYMSPEPNLEREFFSGGVNLSARERNTRRLSDACKVYSVVSLPGKLICAPWVHELLLAGLAADADERIDALYEKQWQLERAGGRSSRGYAAMTWKIQVAEKMRAGPESSHFWKRNPRPELALVDDQNLTGVELAR